MPPAWFSCVVMLALRSPAILLASMYTAYYTDRKRLLAWTGIIPVVAEETQFNSHIDIVTISVPGFFLFLPLLYGSDRCVRRVYLAVLLAVVLPSVSSHVSSRVLPHRVATYDCRPTHANITGCDPIDALRKPLTYYEALGRQRFCNSVFERARCQCYAGRKISSYVGCGCGCGFEVGIEIVKCSSGDAVAAAILLSAFATIALMWFCCKPVFYALPTMLLYVTSVLAVLGQCDIFLDDVTTRIAREFSLVISYVLISGNIVFHLYDSFPPQQDIEDGVQQLCDKYQRTVTATIVSWTVAVPIIVADDILRNTGTTAVDWQLAARVATGSAVMHCGASAILSRVSGFVFSRLTSSISRCLPGIYVELPLHTGLRHQLSMLVCCFVLGPDRFVLSALYTTLLSSARGVSKAVRPLLEKRAGNFDRKSLVTLRCVLLAVGLVPPFAFHVMFSVLVNYNIDSDDAMVSYCSLYLFGILPLISVSYESLFAMIRLAVGLPKGPGQLRAVVLAEASPAMRRCCLVFEILEELGQLIIYCLSVGSLYIFNFISCRAVSAKVAVYLIIVFIFYVITNQLHRMKPQPIHCVAALPPPSVDDPRLADLCAVCMDSMTSEKARKTRCGHVFHCQCLAMCVDVEPSCPMCRGKMF